MLKSSNNKTSMASVEFRKFRMAEMTTDASSHDSIEAARVPSTSTSDQPTSPQQDVDDVDFPLVDGDIIKPAIPMCPRCTDLSNDRQLLTYLMNRRHSTREIVDHNFNFVASRLPANEDEFMCNCSLAPTLSGTSRMLMKNGKANIRTVNIPFQGRKYLADIFTTLTDMNWATSLMIFVGILIGSWIIFAFVWWLIAVYELWPPSWKLMTSTSDNPGEPCLDGVDSFHTALLFSIETQHTIGYGTRLVGYGCPGTVFTLILQSCIGFLISSMLAGLVFIKVSRPGFRRETIMFSEQAVVCRRDGIDCLIFRLGDVRRSHLIGCVVTGRLIRWRPTPNGRSLCDYPLAFETETGDSKLFLAWPATFVHKITPSSALWDVARDGSSADNDQFEIIIILTGVIETTGKLMEICTSYTSSEIVWGARFKPLTVCYTRQDRPRRQRHGIDFTNFNEFIETRSDEMDTQSRENGRQNETSPDDVDNIQKGLPDDDDNELDKVDEDSPWTMFTSIAPSDSHTNSASSQNIYSVNCF